LKRVWPKTQQRKRGYNQGKTGEKPDRNTRVDWAGNRRRGNITKKGATWTGELNGKYGQRTKKKGGGKRKKKQPR